MGRKLNKIIVYLNGIAQNNTRHSLAKIGQRREETLWLFSQREFRFNTPGISS